MCLIHRMMNMNGFRQWLEAADHTSPLPRKGFFQRQFWYSPEFGVHPDALHHTTSLSNALEILRERILKGKDYVSFWRGDEAQVSDISNYGATIVFNSSVIRKLVMPVHYNRKWFRKYRGHGEYIAGQGDEGWGDQALPRWQNFMFKSGENEWISRKEGWLRFPTRAVLALLINNADDLEEVRSELDEMGYADISLEVE